MNLEEAVKIVAQATPEQLAEAQKKAKAPHPARLQTVNLQPVIQMLDENAKRVDECGWEDEDMVHYAWEALMTAFYGPDYWPWRRTVLQ